MSDETEENNFKIVLIGESGVGKTSIISQFVDQIFEDDLQTSTGGSFSSKTLTFNNGKTIKLEIWDTFLYLRLIVYLNQQVHHHVVLSKFQSYWMLQQDLH